MRVNRTALCGSTIALALVGMAASTTRAEDVITTHRLSAALASEAVTEAVAACAKQGYRVSAVVLDIDGETQGILRGDGATVTSLDASHDKAYTAIMLGAGRNEDSTGVIAERMGANPNAGGLVETASRPSAAGRPAHQGRAARRSQRSASAARRAAIWTKPTPSGNRQDQCPLEVARWAPGPRGHAVDLPVARGGHTAGVAEVIAADLPWR